MTLMKRYVLRLFISLKYITANVVDRNNGRIVATASTVEHALKEALECGRSCNTKAAAAVGEVLAMRLKVEGLDQGEGRGIHADVEKEIQKKGFKNQTKDVEWRKEALHFKQHIDERARDGSMTVDKKLV